MNCFVLHLIAYLYYSSWGYYRFSFGWYRRYYHVIVKLTLFYGVTTKMTILNLCTNKMDHMHLWSPYHQFDKFFQSYPCSSIKKKKKEIWACELSLIWGSLSILPSLPPPIALCSWLSLPQREGGVEVVFLQNVYPNAFC